MQKIDDPLASWRENDASPAIRATGETELSDLLSGPQLAEPEITGRETILKHRVAQLAKGSEGINLPTNKDKDLGAKMASEEITREPAILFVKPQAISADDKATLKAAGVLVIEIDDPANAKFVRASVELNGTEMLAVAAKAIKYSDAATKEFGKLMCIALQAAH